MVQTVAYWTEKQTKRTIRTIMTIMTTTTMIEMKRRTQSKNTVSKPTGRQTKTRKRP